MLAAVAGLLIVAAMVALPPVALAQTDATLSALSLSSGALRPTFVATTKEYRAAVKYNVSRITVTATAANGGTVEYLDASGFTLADANTNGLQVDLGVGETAFKVKVTNGAATETYTVTVERDSARLFGWTPSRDINALEAAGNASPQGIWSDETTMWVADDDDDKLYAYTLASGAHDVTKDISLHTDNGDPQGIWSDETTMWVADDDDDKLYAYTLASGARDATKDISLHADNGDPTGIWSDGTTIWVANNSFSPRKVFAYTLSGGANDTAKEFMPNWNPVGIWSNGTTMWVIAHITDILRGQVDAYTIDLNPDGTAGPNHGRRDRNTDKRFALRSPGETTPVGIWSDGKGAVWITAPDSPKVESYHMLPFSAGSTTLSALAINDGTSDATLRPAFASTTLNYRTSVADDVNRVTVSATPSGGTATVAYLDENGEALEDADSNTDGFQVEVAVGTTPIQILVTAQDGAAFIHGVVVERDSGLPGGWTPTDDLYNLDPVAVNYPRGIWSDGTTMWLTNRSKSTVFAYTLATSTRDTDKEFSLHADNGDPWGIWSDGTTIWVIDNQDNKGYAYTLATGLRDAAKEFGLDADNSEAWGIWSDGTTVWISDSLDNKLYAYTLATSARDGAKEFDLAANTQRTGIWSDGTTLWAADRDADTLFAYTLANGAPDPARDIILSQPVPEGVSGKGSTIWVADAGLAVFGVPTTLHRVYSYRLPPSSPNDVTLSSLSLSPSPLVPLFTANLRPAFSYARASYRVAVPNQASRVTVSAVANNSGTMVAYLDANGDALVDADDGAMGFQVDVAVGETAIGIRLASGGAALTYTVVVERDSAALYGWTPSKDLNNLLQDNPALAGDAIRGVWGDETTIYTVAHLVPKVFAYTRANEARDESKDIATNQGSLAREYGFKAGVWSNGTTMWVLNYVYGEDMDGNETGAGTGKIFAFKLSDGTRDTAKEFPLHLEETYAARGIWSDGITVWISNYKDAKLFAYTLATGASVPASDITLHHLNDSAQGIWSDGTTIWVAQFDSLKFFAYTLATGAYDPDNDFDRAPGNRFPRDVWSDGTTLYVTDHFDKKLFAYKMTYNPATGAPVITAPNVFRVPAVLSVDLSGITDADGVTGIATTATYKWQRFDSTGANLETDSIGTDSTYTLTDADAGKTLKVVVSFSDDGGNSEGPLTSDATSAVTAAASCDPPTYVGGATQVWTGKVGVAKHMDFYGYYDDTTLSFGSLDETRFSISSNNYRVDRVFTQPGPSLAFSMKSDFTSDEQKTLALHICDQAFAFSVAGAPTSGSTYAFDATDFPGADLDWSPHAERTIYLSQDTTVPTLTSATVNGTTLVMNFTEPLGAAASLANTAFRVEKNGVTTALTLSSTAPAISGSMVTLTLAAASSVSASDTNVLVSYTKPTTGTANKLVDAAGKEAASFTDQPVGNLLADSTAPELAAAVLAADGLTLTLTYNEALKTTSVPDRDVFTVEATPIGGSEETLNLAADQRRERDRQHGGAEAGQAHGPQRRLGQGDLREAHHGRGDRGRHRQRRRRVLGPGGDQQQHGAARQHRGGVPRRHAGDCAPGVPVHALEHRHCPAHLEPDGHTGRQGLHHPCRSHGPFIGDPQPDDCRRTATTYDACIPDVTYLGNTSGNLTLTVAGGDDHLPALAPNDSASVLMKMPPSGPVALVTQPPAYSVREGELVNERLIATTGAGVARPRASFTVAIYTTAGTATINTDYNHISNKRPISGERLDRHRRRGIHANTDVPVSRSVPSTTTSTRPTKRSG